MNHHLLIQPTTIMNHPPYQHTLSITPTSVVPDEEYHKALEINTDPILCTHNICISDLFPYIECNVCS